MLLRILRVIGTVLRNSADTEIHALALFFTSSGTLGGKIKHIGVCGRKDRNKWRFWNWGICFSPFFHILRINFGSDFWWSVYYTAWDCCLCPSTEVFDSNPACLPNSSFRLMNILGYRSSGYWDLSRNESGIGWVNWRCLSVFLSLSLSNKVKINKYISK